MKPIEALMFALVKRYALEFVPASMRGDFDLAMGEVQQVLARDASLADWVGKKTARIDTWQGVLEPPQPEDGIWAIVSVALFTGQNLEIDYLGESGEMHHEVRPLALVERDEVLYVVLQFSGFENARLIALHRIVRAVVVPGVLQPEEVPLNIDTFLKNGLPFTLPGEQLFDLCLRLDESVYRTIKGRPPLNTTSISIPVDGWFEVRAKAVPNTMELRWWLLGFGDKVRILEPECLARELQYLLFDALTGLLTRRACQEHFERLIAAANRTGKPLAVIMADIDHFKWINDELGHAAGDSVLREVSRRLKIACRSMDVVGRWGGEEFLILLPETSLDEAAVLVERLRMAVAESPCHVDEHGTVRNVTISIGVTFLSTKTAEMRLPGLIERLLKEADAALYVAKQVRNRVEIFHG